ncbi:hypothetical protein BN3659_02235 [Alistipes sp. CHKCI003]|nr:hypothetical protein BN3659_02235 [Alistipes sp. CHKCI003]
MPRPGKSNIVRVSLAYYLLHVGLNINWLCYKKKIDHISKLLQKNQIKSKAYENI